MESANQVWCPHLLKDIEVVKNVQHRATKLVPCLKNMSYEDRLKTIDLPTLIQKISR